MKLTFFVLAAVLATFPAFFKLAGTEVSDRNAETEPDSEPASEEEPTPENSVAEGEPVTGSSNHSSSPDDPNEVYNNVSSEDSIPESENIPNSEHNTENPDSEIAESEHSQGEGEPEGDDQYADSLVEPEQNPQAENGFVNLPFFDFPDGEVPTDYFIPVDERFEPIEENGEPEDVPEYWWDLSPEHFYDDEYAYLNSLAEAESEGGIDIKSESEAEPESEAESENEAEPESITEPEFEYMATFKGSKKKFGTKKLLRVLIAVLSVVCGSLGVVIIILSYKGHRQYREAKLDTPVDDSGHENKGSLWRIPKRLLRLEIITTSSGKPEMTSCNKQQEMTS